MSRLFITPDNLKIFIKNLKKTCDEFIAPKKEHLNDVIFSDTKNSQDELLDYTGNAILSLRQFLLPQTEILFKIESAKSGKFIAQEDKKKRIFFGVRPCDIKAAALMREFFLGEFTDEPYKERIERSLFIALACNKRCSPKAFCDEIGAGPAAKDGFDLQFLSLSRGYIVDIGSSAGRRIIKTHKKLFFPPKPADEKEARGNFNDFIKETKKINYTKLARIMREDEVSPSVWEDIGMRCVVCSGCITVCPTCSCFSIADRLHNDKGLRLRYCDGCPYAGFTRMAGGTTPFALHKDHIRRFFEHKLNIDVARYNTPSCVGCGRCIETCPGNISIRKFIEDAVK